MRGNVYSCKEEFKSIDKILDELVDVLLENDWKEKGVGWKVSAILGKVKLPRQESKRLNEIMDIAGIA